MWSMHVRSQSCLTLCDPVDHSPAGSSVHGTLQARTLERVAISSSRDLPDPGLEPASLCLLPWQVGSVPLCHLRNRKYGEVIIIYVQVLNCGGQCPDPHVIQGSTLNSLLGSFKIKIPSPVAVSMSSKAFRVHSPTVTTSIYSD